MKCSFCGNAQGDARRLIAGPGGVAICSDCVGLCNEILAHELAPGPSTASPSTGGWRGTVVGAPGPEAPA